MAFWTDKKGNKLTFKQFMTRWKKGLEGVNSYQQTTMQIWSTWIIIIGILCGLVITFFALATVWWLTIILFGALFNTSVQLLGLWQKKQVLRKFNLHIPTQFETEKEKAKVTEEGEAEEFLPLNSQKEVLENE